MVKCATSPKRRLSKKRAQTVVKAVFPDARSVFRGNASGKTGPSCAIYVSEGGMNALAIGKDEQEAWQLAADQVVSKARQSICRRA